MFQFVHQQTVAQVITVNSSRDLPSEELNFNEITLRKALEEVNDGLYHTIHFNIPDQTLPIHILLNNDLPIIQNNLVIDGNTQPGSLANGKKILVDGKGFRIFESAQKDIAFYLENMSLSGGRSPLVKSNARRLFCCSSTLSAPVPHNGESVAIEGVDQMEVDRCIIGSAPINSPYLDKGIVARKTAVSNRPTSYNIIEHNVFNQCKIGVLVDGLYAFEIENNVFQNIKTKPIQLINNGNAGVLTPIISVINLTDQLSFIQGVVANPIDGIRMMGKVSIYKTNPYLSVITTKIGEVIVSTNNQQAVWKIEKPVWEAELYPGDYITAQFTQLMSPVTPYIARYPETSAFSSPKRACDLRVSFITETSCGNKVNFIPAVGSNQVITMDWDFGDNNFLTQKGEVSHTYAQAGTYKVLLNVKEEECEATYLDSVALPFVPSVTDLTINRSSCGGSVSFNIHGVDSMNWYDLIFKQNGEIVAHYVSQFPGPKIFGDFPAGRYEFQIYDRSTGCYSVVYYFDVEGGTLKIEQVCAVEDFCIHPNPLPDFSVLITDENPEGNGLPYTINVYNQDGEKLEDYLGNSDFKGIVGEPLAVEYLPVYAGEWCIVKLVEVGGKTTCALEKWFKGDVLDFSLDVADQQINTCNEGEDSVNVSIDIVLDNVVCDMPLSRFTYVCEVFKAREDGTFPTEPYASFQSPEKHFNLSIKEDGVFKVKAKAQVRYDDGSIRYSCEVKEAIFKVETVAIPSEIEVELIKENPKCIDGFGSAKAIIHGLKGTTTYFWTKKGGSEIIAHNTTTVEGLTAGETYQFHVEEEGVCPVDEVYSVDIEASALFNNAQISLINNCLLEASIAGDTGVPPYDYTWIYYPKKKVIIGGVDITDFRIIHHEKDVVVSSYHDPKPGYYYVLVKDANGCEIKSDSLRIDPIKPRGYNLCMRFTNVDTLLLKSSPPYLPPEWKCNIWQDVQASIDNQLQNCLDKNIGVFEQVGENFCHDLNNIEDEVSVSYSIKQGHYTLYYYDRSGQLVRTVPPEGVDDLEAKRIPKKHTYVTQYRYNGLKQLVEQKLPDHDGRTAFRYNKKGQLRYSQNAQQRIDGKFSYTNYDKIGRVVEIGEMAGDFLAQDSTYMPFGTRVFYAQTFYTKPAENIRYLGKPQRYLDNRVSYTQTIDEAGKKSSDYFSYDPHGNVEWIIREIPNTGSFTMEYDYDLISGNVKKVVLNAKRPDQFFHRFTYDEDNRITAVSTSKDGYIWEKDAQYQYYQHGPLARTEIGEDRIQGLDYLYTVQGWLKAINSPVTKPEMDLGKDGINSTAPNAFAPDVFAMVLGYYDGDFIRTGSTQVFNSTADNPLYAGNQQNLYNGNISLWQTHYAKGTNLGEEPMTRQLRYDKLNRLKASGTYWLNEGHWNSSAAYSSTYFYDGNGNLKNLSRQGYGSTLDELKMDGLTYHYLNTSDGLPTNKLGYVSDGVTYVAKDPNDPTKDRYDDIRSQSPNNYGYDAIGNLVKDVSEEIEIEWNSFGKIAAVIPKKSIDTVQQKPHLTFTYDATGNRIIKQVNNRPGFNAAGEWINTIESPEDVTTTYYTRDATGNTVSIYERTNIKPNYTAEELEENPQLVNYYEAVFTQKEVPVYGSDRIGQYAPNLELGRVLFHKDNFDEVATDFSTNSASEAHSGTQNIVISAVKEVVVEGSRSYKGAVLTLNLETEETQEVFEMEGTITNNIALAENQNGELLILAATSSIDTDSSQTLLTDKMGKVIKSYQLVPKNLDSKAKAIIIKKPGNKKIYYYFNRTINGKLTYAVINLHKKGYGTEEAPLGEITKTGMLAPALKIGRHFAAIEDAYKGVSYLYCTATDTTTAEARGIYRFVISKDGLITEELKLLTYISSDEEGRGELKISPDGKYLFLYNLKEKMWLTWEGEINRYTFKNDYTLLTSVEDIKTFTTTGPAIEKGTLDFAEEGKTLLYSTMQTGIFGQIGTTRSIDLTQDKAPYLITSNHFGGDIIRLNHNNYKVLLVDNQLNKFVLMRLKEGKAVRLKIITPKEDFRLEGGVNTYVHKIPDKTTHVFYRQTGKKQYEIKDHLGNIRATVSDVKTPTIAGQKIIALNAKILSATDYYPFGMQMPGRSFSSGSYRYGFNGKEKDDEVKGGGNSYDYGFRIYNPRIAKFLSVDPMTRGYSMLTPYQYASNSPIKLIDIDGLEGGVPGDVANFGYYIEQEVTSAVDAIGSSIESTWNVLGSLFASEEPNIAMGVDAISGAAINISTSQTTTAAPWMKVAESQLGVKEATGKNDGLVVEGYLKTAGLSKGNAWCGAFVNYCIEESGIDGVEPSKTEHPARALSWRGFGDKLEEPVYGAIATKKRKGGGHVGFVAGKTEDGKIVLLGGNQNDQVNYTPYSQDILKFNYPSDKERSSELPTLKVEGGKVKEN